VTKKSKVIDIRLSDQQAEAIKYIEHSKEVTEVLYGGAAGSGKSFLGCVWQIYRRIHYPETRGLIGRAKLKTLKLTTLRTFREVWSRMFEGCGVTWKHNSHDEVIYFSNGSEIVLKDLFQYPSDKDFASLGSLEITDAFIDEVTEITKKAKEIVKSRIRYRLINNKPILLMGCNPASNWVKFEYVMDKQNRPVSLKDHQRFVPAKVQDNPNKDFVKVYTANLMELSQYDRDRLLYGDWTAIANEQPFFYTFSKEKHCGKCEYAPNETILISCDFNYNPATAIIGYVDDEAVKIFDCIEVEGGTEALCNELVKRGYSYNSEMPHLGVIQLTGDASGKSMTSRSQQNDYDILLDRLSIPRSVLFAPPANPSHSDSQALCASFFHHLPVCIDEENCGSLISDLEQARTDSKGALYKDRDMGLGMDLADCLRYFVNKVVISSVVHKKQRHGTIKDVMRLRNSFLVGN
jgi:hypothetical protein